MSVSTPIAPPAPFRVGVWIVEPDNGRLIQGETEIRLEPKVMEVLVCLAQQPGTVVSRESLEAKVWTNMVVGYDAVAGSIIKLRKALGDDSRNPRYVETVSKKGYRLIAPVAPVKDQASASAFSHSYYAEKGSAIKTTRKNLTFIVIGAIAVLAVLAYFVFPLQEPIRVAPTANTPSIVVLPFKHLSENSQQEYLSDGITDDLITDLSKIGSLRVIARQSSYHYKNNPTSLSNIADQLKVTYIVEGSVQRSGQRIRVNVQLTDAKKGESIWAKRFDTDVGDIFNVQDDITKNVVRAMYLTMSGEKHGQAETRGTKYFEAYDAFLLGQQHIQMRTRQGYEQARKYFRRAIEIDPDYARAYGAMAVAITRGYRYQWTDLTLVEARERALSLAKKAVELDDSSPQIYWALGYVHVHRHEFAEAERAAKQTVDISPNYADGYALRANIANYRGKSDDAVDFINKAMERDPYHSYQYLSTLGLSYYLLGKFEDSVAVLRRAIDRNENALNPRLYLAAVYVQLGRLDDAEWEVNQIKISRPQVRLDSLITTLPFEHSMHRDKLLRDLRKAGLPE